MKSAIKYPVIPLTGIRIIINNTRKDKPTTVVIKVVDMRPTPFNMLDKVVPTYKRGQSQERFWRNFPESSLWKNKYPSSLPNNKNTNVQNNPIRRLYFIVFSVMLLM